MLQLDLFSARGPESLAPREDRATEALSLAGIFARLSDVAERPRYSFMVLSLIARAADASGSAGPWVRTEDGALPIRDWLSDALVPVAQRAPRRIAIVASVRRELERQGALPADPRAAERLVEAQTRLRIRASGRTNVSRAVSELVRAGLIRRHYQGYRVDHENRGAQRHAVYTLLPETRRALAGWQS